MSKGKSMQGLEGCLLGGEEQRKELIDNMKMYVGVVYEPRHILAGKEMHSTFMEFYGFFREHLNHRQYDELYKLVKDNLDVETETIDHFYKVKYLAGNK